MSSFRFILEQLAIRDVFGCMTTQLPPSILNVAFSPWFFEAEQWSYGDDEWESVERMFGRYHIVHQGVGLMAQAFLVVLSMSLPEYVSGSQLSNSSRGTVELTCRLALLFPRSSKAVSHSSSRQNLMLPTFPSDFHLARAALASQAKTILRPTRPGSGRSYKERQRD
jgi:hypothetical protein